MCNVVKAPTHVEKLTVTFLFVFGMKTQKEKKKGFCRRNSKPRPDYRNAPWAKLLVENIAIRDPDTSEGQLFRRRFRVPFPIFEIIVSIVRREMWFREGGRRNGINIFVTFLLNCF